MVSKLKLKTPKISTSRIRCRPNSFDSLYYWQNCAALGFPHLKQCCEIRRRDILQKFIGISTTRPHSAFNTTRLRIAPSFHKVPEDLDACMSTPNIQDIPRSYCYDQQLSFIDISGIHMIPEIQEACIGLSIRSEPNISVLFSPSDVSMRDKFQFTKA